MKDYLKVYEENKKLDAKYVEIYGDNAEILEKNILEFLVELGEFANETKCFKYWSKKKMGAKEIVLEEFADCITMCFYFCNLLNVDLCNVEPKNGEDNIVRKFISLYKKVSVIENNFNKEYIIDIFTNLISLGHSFNFTDEEITKSCLNKIQKNIDRINSNNY